MNVHSPSLACISYDNTARRYLLLPFCVTPPILCPVFSPCWDRRLENVWIIDHYLIYQRCQSYWRFGDGGDTDGKAREVARENGGGRWFDLSLGQLRGWPQRPEISIFRFLPSLSFSPPSPALILAQRYHGNPYVHNKMLKSLQVMKTGLSEGDMGMDDANQF